jgi:hypothetical protein
VHRQRRNQMSDAAKGEFNIGSAAGNIAVTAAGDVF